VLRLEGHTVLVAYKGNTWMVIGATVPFTDCSCGHVGVNDGWTDLADNYLLDWQYDAALDGNIALTGRLDISKGSKFTVAVAFGTTKHNALSTLAQSLRPASQKWIAASVAWSRCETHSFTHRNSAAVISPSGGAGNLKVVPEGITQVCHLPAPGST
jgi:glucoamylase